MKIYFEIQTIVRDGLRMTILICKELNEPSIIDVEYTITHRREGILLMVEHSGENLRFFIIKITVYLCVCVHTQNVCAATLHDG